MEDLDLYCPPAAQPTRYRPVSGIAPSISEYLTPPTTPTEDTEEPVAQTLPTWVAVPPTPPLNKLQDPTSADYVPPHMRSLPPSTSLPLELQTHEGEVILEEARSMQRELEYQASLPTSSSDPISHAQPQPSPTAYVDEATTTSRSRRPLFHVLQDGSDNEDEDEALEEPEREQSDLVHWHFKELRQKDDARRAHALVELLSTEVGYLADLRVLVNVYLRNLATFDRVPTSAFQRSSSFVASSRPNSAGQSYFPPVGGGPDGFQPSTTIQPKEKEKTNSKRVFSEAQLRLLARNATEVLEFHERFVKQLQVLVVQMGLPMPVPGVDFGESFDDHLGKIDDVIRVVSTKFATESSRFYEYESFCAGHPDALDLIRKIQHQYPSDWMAFEQECSLSVTNQQLNLACTEDSGADPPNSPTQQSTVDHGTSSSSSCQSRPRARSTPSVEVNGAREWAAKHRPHRLAFLDYMIKPVQRICKYPMLLQQLKSKGLTSESGEVDVVVDSAAQAMHHVAGSVDEARHRQSVAVQSRLITNRLMASAASTSCKRFFATNTDGFFVSLGICLLAGSLDVIHFQLPVSPKSAKYMGAFLYVGGYLILAKVKGKNYEPRHWFPLADFSLVDVASDEEILPCSFRLSSRYAEFEFAAACQKEKEAWVSAIKQSLTFQPNWRQVPQPSVQPVDDLSPHGLDETHEVESPIGGTQGPPDSSSYIAEEGSGAPKQRSKTLSRCESAYRPDVAVSRRSSTTSIKKIFVSNSGTDLPTMLINRSSASARHHVDQGLQDVISEPCLIARSAASRQDRELFSAPRLHKSGLPRSASGLSITGAVGNAAKRRLSRHESLRVPRRKSMIDASFDPSLTRFAVHANGLPRGYPMSTRSALEIERPMVPHFCDSPTTSSQPSPAASASSSTPNSVAESRIPTTRTRRLRIQSEQEAHLPRPTTASGVVSPFPSELSSDSQGFGRKASHGASFFKRWAKIHRRSRSASDVKEMEAILPLSLTSSPPSQEECPILPELPPVGSLSPPIPSEGFSDDSAPQHETPDLPSSPVNDKLHLTRSGSRGQFRNMNIPFLHRFL